ncbi:MAG: hypothetical protein LBK47_08750 [Prevotellaceae bacterium]|nr:hypothetical protein [Prevotellaceae bacterium]
MRRLRRRKTPTHYTAAALSFRPERSGGTSSSPLLGAGTAEEPRLSMLSGANAGTAEELPPYNVALF